MVPVDQRELIHEADFLAADLSPATTFKTVVGGNVIDGQRITIWGFTTAQDITVSLKVLIDDQVVILFGAAGAVVTPGTSFTFTTEDVFLPRGDLIIEFTTGGSVPDRAHFEVVRSYR